MAEEMGRGRLTLPVGFTGGMILGNILPDPVGDSIHFLWSQPLLASNCVVRQTWPGWQCTLLQVVDWYLIPTLGWVVLLLIALAATGRTPGVQARAVFYALGLFVGAGILINLYFSGGLGFGLPSGAPGSVTVSQSVRVVG